MTAAEEQLRGKQARLEQREDDLENGSWARGKDVQEVEQVPLQKHIEEPKNDFDKFKEGLKGMFDTSLGVLRQLAADSNAAVDDTAH